ncbi:beta-ketoacyl synthase N-terminal-like domain-containing protein [Streptomyces sp. NPDC002669]|uniref:beta-ketoacyl synthase N-terminal-like domain-containing protein n=1 Tax=unclassified Streptomyces TaxID=2593676 RepID=UPI0036809274
MSWLVGGVGAVAGVGRDPRELFDGLCAGRSAHAELRGFDRSRYAARYAYEIDDRPVPGADVPGRATKWLLEAVGQAARDAGLGEDLSDVPVLIGTGLRELRSVELWWRDGTPLEADRLHFDRALRERFNTTATYTFANACSASLYALAMGTDLLELGEADTVIAAGVDVLTESMYGLVERVHPVPPDRVRPFDRDRTGAVMGDGAAAVVLRRDDGNRRGRAHGRLRAVGLNCDAHHATAPDDAGIASAIRQAHDLAGMKPKDIDLVMLHGTGTLLNDEAEATAVAEVFGPHVGRPLMTAIKSMTGHTSGASGLIGMITAMRALEEGRVPPTLGLSHPVEEAEGFRFVTGEEAVGEMSVAQINAFGFGGINAVAVVEAVR